MNRRGFFSMLGASAAVPLVVEWNDDKPDPGPIIESRPEGAPVIFNNCVFSASPEAVMKEVVAILREKNLKI